VEETPTIIPPQTFGELSVTLSSIQLPEDEEQDEEEGEPVAGAANEELWRDATGRGE
jgi:hypothetical protein